VKPEKISSESSGPGCEDETVRQKLETTEILVHALAGSVCLLVVSQTGTFKCALPPHGELKIGRDAICDVRVDDASVSRHHATLRVGSKLQLIDLGSRNGTLIGDRRITPHTPVEISLGDAIRIGDAVLVLQATTAGAAALWFSDRADFETRLDEQILVAHKSSSTFSLVRVVVHRRVESEGARPATPLDRLLSDALRPVDLFSARGPGDFEIGLPDITSAAAERVIARIRQRLADGGYTAAIGAATSPEDGPTRAALQREAEAGLVDATVPKGPGVDLRGLLGVLPTLDRIASSTINVLILGETGVGKEVVANAIHQLSPRVGAPLVCLNCCALSENLLESELFGHERGAFTGALRAKIGLLEAAQGGTLFLDEIGEMSLGLQAKFLRVLEQKEVTRVGALKPRPIDVRIVAATNRELEAEIDVGRFRQDLYFRLNGVTVNVPPLRERLDELEPLVQGFVSRAAELSGVPTPSISPEVLALLRAYRWPGNIRELRNIAERAVLLCEGDVIQLHHLPADKMAPDLPNRTGASVPATMRPPPPPSVPMTETRALPTVPFDPDGPAEHNSDPERMRIVDALHKCHGNQTKAAELLGISRRTLVSRLTEYELPRPRKTGSDQHRSEKGRT
jgi:two-component system response regulator AtoC